MMNAITHWIEEKLIAIWDFCAGALERDRLARKARPKREAEPLIVVPIPQARSKWALGLIVGALGVLLLRVGYLQVFNNDFLQNQGEIRYARTISVEGARGNILDRNGVVLASSQPSRSIWADPEFVDFNEKDKLQQVAKILEIPYKELISKIKNSSSKNFVYLSRNRDLTVGEQIRELNVPGIGISPESRRQYPDGPVMAHILGFTDRSDHGQEGVELAKDYVLSGQAGARRVIRDRRGRIVDDVWTKEAEAGQDVQLSIDSRVQFLAYSALSRQVEATKAIAGAVLVADATTGEIIALANVPTYDPNDRSTVLFERMRNRVLTDMFEPGSTMKPFAIAKGLDMGIVDPLTTIQTAPGKLTIGDRTIGDTHNYGLLTVAQVVAKSSNIGTAKIALEIPPATLYDTYSELGFGRAPNIGFPGASSGRMRPAKTWRPIEQATMSYGHGISVSLTQLVRAYTALARNGDVIDLTLFKRSEGTEVKGTQVFKPETARRMRAMMMDTVRRGGTASNVKVDGYTVAGKTGTALKAKNGAYTKDVVASFVGIVPATQPRFIIAVMVDEPKNGRYGGRVAAPVFNEVAEGALRTLLVSPDDKESLFSQSAPTKAKN
ncbi:MAG: penicillin-binding protein 2 [Sutterella wadsworthensis]|jgi:cell division ftsI protein/penicillin-binding protein 2|nr:penicillin-binding protein 2 [Sutterella wadsworthensis]